MRRLKNMMIWLGAFALWLTDLLTNPKYSKTPRLVGAALVSGLLLFGFVAVSFTSFWAKAVQDSGAVEMAGNMAGDMAGNLMGKLDTHQVLGMIQSVDQQIDRQLALVAGSAGAASSSAKSDVAEAANIAGTFRLDPFAPLVVEPSDSAFGPGGPGVGLSGMSAMPIEVKPEQLVAYTGLIKESAGKRYAPVAILHLSDSMSGGGKTVVKKVGESFKVDGKKVIVKRIYPDRVALLINGKVTTKKIQPYVDSVAARKKDEQFGLVPPSASSQQNAPYTNNNQVGFGRDLSPTAPYISSAGAAAPGAR